MHATFRQDLGPRETQLEERFVQLRVEDGVEGRHHGGLDTVKHSRH
jgi:hypothetical protein